MASKLERVAKILLENRGDPSGSWGNSSGNPKKRANKFLLACILEYQMEANTVWENARRFAEDILHDPDELWHKIAGFSKDEWMDRWKIYGLHRFPKAHERVWRIGSEIVSSYQGDARRIWKGRPPEIVLSRLQEMRVGPQISRMIVGALIDTEQITGVGDLKADSNVNRVLGRVFEGHQTLPEKATELARKMSPSNPWLLDYPLYLLGKKADGGKCLSNKPRCYDCYLRSECLYASVRN